MLRLSTRPPHPSPLTLSCRSVRSAPHACWRGRPGSYHLDCTRAGTHLADKGPALLWAAPPEKTRHAVRHPPTDVRRDLSNDPMCCPARTGAVPGSQPDRRRASHDRRRACDHADQLTSRCTIVARPCTWAILVWLTACMGSQACWAALHMMLHPCRPPRLLEISGIGYCCVLPCLAIHSTCISCRRRLLCPMTGSWSPGHQVTARWAA